MFLNIGSDTLYPHSVRQSVITSTYLQYILTIVDLVTEEIDIIPFVL